MTNDRERQQKQGTGGMVGDLLRAFVDRIERLEEEKRTLSEDLKEVYAEAKGAGFDAKALRALIRERRIDPDDRAEQESILDTYRAALAGWERTPLGDAAERRAAE